MNRRGTLSVLALYEVDNALFSDLVLPDGIDRTLVIDNILLECATLETRFPNWRLMQHAISRWSRSRYRSWERMYRALTEDYNPLHNFDRHEDYTDTGTGSDTENTTNYGDTTGRSGNTSTTTGSTSGTGSRDIKNYVNGFNEEAEHDRTDEDSSSSGSSTETTTGSGESSSDYREAGSRNTSRNSSNTHSGHLYGNIGVTTSATMLREELEIRQNDIYKTIVTEFREWFCVLVY